MKREAETQSHMEMGQTPVVAAFIHSTPSSRAPGNPVLISCWERPEILLLTSGGDSETQRSLGLQAWQLGSQVWGI